MTHIFGESGRVEWIALVFLQRCVQEMYGHEWQDIHNNHAPAVKDIDFYVDGVSADLKADTYFAQLKPGEASTRYKKRDSGNLALETISTDFSRVWSDDIRPDPNQPTMKMGWMHTSRAQELWYYFITLDNSEQELDALADGRTPENEAERQWRLLECARIHRDELLVLPTGPLKEWFWGNYQFFGRRPVSNRGYHTWIRQVPRAALLESGLVSRHVTDLADRVLRWHHNQQTAARNDV